MLETVITSALTAILASIGTFFVQRERLKTELKTEFMAEEAIKSLLENDKWKKRSFSAIKKRIRGFEDSELRKLLVRAGAVCFEGEDETELWGLKSKNEEDL